MHFTRRRFIKRTLAASTVLTFTGSVPALLQQTALAQTKPGKDNTILVVLQLSGGNDGLNTVIPFEDDTYHRKRPTLRLTANQVLKITPQLGLHPEMPGFLRLFKDGSLGILQGVGYPKSSRDHAKAMLHWQSARPEETGSQTGWLGRAADALSFPGNTAGIFAGDIKAPFAIRTERVIVPSIRNVENWTVPPKIAREEETPQAASVQGEANSVRDYIRQVSRQSQANSRRILEAAAGQGTAGAVRYPEFRLAQHLKTVAQLIRAQVGLRIYFLELGGGGIGGFDTHAGQALNHGALLRELSESVAAFVEDLRRDRLLDQMLLFTYSEFGRTVTESGRRGTDHGIAAPMFTAGGKLKGGVLGPHPSLTDLEGDGLKYHTDFRSVYATALERWLGLDSQAILGQDWPRLDYLGL